MINDYTKKELYEALEECVKLQCHYAELLNMHDGGMRIGFKTVDDFIARMRELKLQREKK